MFGPVAACEAFIFNAFKISGRASRSEYWWPALVFGVLLIVAVIADVRAIAGLAPGSGQGAAGLMSFWSPLLLLLLLVPNTTCTIRRLHDSGRSGFWFLLTFLPVLGGLIYLVLMVLPSQQGANAWGQPRGNPRHGRAPETDAAPAEGRRRGHRPGPLDSYAMLLQAGAEPSPAELARRKQEVHEYFMRNVSQRADA